MSYDLKIWSTNKPNFDEDFINHNNLIAVDDLIIYREKEWQIVINSVNKVEDEDIPENISSLLPGICYCTEINLEPISAPKKAQKVLDKISTIIAKSSYGLIVDEQNDTVKTPSGIKRLNPIPKTENKNLMTISWWFINDDEFKKDGLKNFINLIDSNIPEAMPRKYGLYEPCQFKLAEYGKEHFINFMYENYYDTVVWYPCRPFEYIHFGVPNPIGPHKLGFRVGQIHMEFYEEVMKQAGWPLALFRFWLKASDIIKPFFSFINYGPSGSWWWNGIPVKTEGDKGSIAAMIGDPYVDLWPEFMSVATKTSSGLYYVSNIVEEYKDTFPLKIPVPPEIAQPPSKKTYLKSGDVTGVVIIGNEKTYPKIWPFDGPFKE